MNKLLKMLTVTLTCLCAWNAFGDSLYEDQGGIRWYYSVTNDEATIIGQGRAFAGDIVFPEKLGGYPVVALRENSIYAAGNATSITFPDSFRTFGARNFYYAQSLTNMTFGTGLRDFSPFQNHDVFQSFTVPEGNPYFTAEGAVLYSKDKKTLVMCGANVTAFTVPSGVTAIGPSAFREIGSLTSVTLPEGLLEIGDNAFYGCDALAAVNLPSTLQVLGGGAFADCRTLAGASIPAKVAKIGDGAFSACMSLSSLTIAEGVKDIGNSAFNGCVELVKVVVPNSVTNIGGWAFEYCSKLSDVTIGSGVVRIGDPAEWYMEEWDGEEWPALSEPSTAFGDCDSLLDFKLADGNTVYEEIGGCLFFRDTPKESKTLAVYPSGRTDFYFTGDVNVTTIAPAACAYCGKLEDIVITNSVREIGIMGFSNCNLLRKVLIPDGPTNVSYGAFQLNMQLADVEIAGTVKKIGDFAFMHCYMPDDPVIGRLILHEGIEEIGEGIINRTRDIYEIVVPDSVTKIGAGAFSDSDNLTRLTLGSGVTEIPNSLCCYEQSLKKVTIRGKVKSIDAYAFEYCNRLESIDLPDSLEYIGYRAFRECSMLSYAFLSAATIDSEAFMDCNSLARVDFADSVRTIETNAFCNCYALQSVIIPEGIETIAPRAFWSCGITTAYLPEKLRGAVETDQSVYDSIFYRCPLDDENIFYYGSEGPAQVTVTYMSQGEVVETCKYLANTLDYLPRVTADGLAFAGWYTAEEGGHPLAAEDLTADLTVYARWVESPFINTGVQEWNPAADDAFPGEVVWRTDGLTGGGSASASFAVTGPAVVNFQWRQESNNVSDYITVYVDGEEAVFTQSAEWEKATLQVPESGSHVVTWTYRRESWSDDPFTASASLADIRVVPGTAKTIVFDVNGGTLDEDWDATRKVVTVLGDLPFAEKDDVAFAGWWTAREGGERVTAATEPEGDATYYAHWVELPFTVSGSGQFWLSEDGSWATLRSYEGYDITASVRIQGPCVISFDWRHAASRYFTSIFRVDGGTKYSRDKDKGWETVTWTIEDTEEHEIEWYFSWGYSSQPGQMLLKNISMGTPYEIAFDPGDDAAVFNSDVDRQELGIGYCTRGGTLGHLPAATSDGYMAFDGWYTAVEGGERVTSETPVTGPATYYAHWVESPVMTYWLRSWLFEPDGSLVSDNDCNEYNSSVAEKHLEGPGTLTFRWRMQSDSGNGYFAFLVNDPTITDYVETNRLTKSSGEWVTERYVFTNENYTWVRWAYGVEGDRGGNEHGWIKDIKWVSNVVDTVEWTVSFNANGGELKGDAEKVVTDEMPIGRMPGATKTDYNFVGWFTEAEGGEEVTRETIVTTNLDLFAHWQYVEPTPPGPPEPPAEKVWTVTFDANGGELVGEPARSVTNECAVGTLPVATKADSSLIGWFTEAEGGEAVTAATIATSDMTVYAHWTFDGIVINTDRSYTTEDDGSFTLVLPIESGSKPTVKVTGLPSGITFTANTLTISGKAKAPGISSVTVSATNAKVKTPVTQAFNLVVPNFTTPMFEAAGLKTDEGGYELQAGAAPDLSAVIAAIKDGGWKLAVAGLPSGLKYDDKSNAITGVATKEGTYTVTFTATKGKDKEVATATFTVAFPTLSIEVAAYDDESATNKVKVSGGGKYPVGAKVSLKATPDRGNVFAGWYGPVNTACCGMEPVYVTGLLSQSATYSYVATDFDVALTALFATEDEDKKSLKVSIPDDTTDEDGTYELDLSNTNLVSSLSQPKLTVKGLPTGLKFDSKTGLIAGKATKPGEYTVKVEATNTSVKKATEESTCEFTLAVPNFKSDLFTTAGLHDKYDLAAGAAPDLSAVISFVKMGEWKLKVDGLPAGLKYDDKSNAITGVATKEGAFTVSFTATKGTGKAAEKEVATATFVVAYPTLALEVAPYGEEAATNNVKVAGGGKYSVGAKVSLKATPGKGNVFAGWLDSDGKPLAGSVDYRTASYSYVATSADATLKALFATEAEDVESLKVTVMDATTDDDGTYELDLGACVESASIPKLAVSGLPTGLKLDAKTLVVSGKATKPGVYTVTVKATNTSVKKAVESTFRLTVPNKVSAALPNLKPATDAYDTVVCGVAFNPALVDCTPAEGWTVKVAGLPTGLKYDAKTGKITGVSTAKDGSYTVTFTATQGKSKQEATITLNVKALPDWAVGSFDGATDGGVVSATVAANGKVTAKVLVDGATLSLSAASFDSVERPKSEAESPVFLATLVGKVGKALVTNEVELASAVVDGVTVGVVSGVEVSETPVTWTAWQNLWKRADTKGDMPVFKKSFDKTVELGEKGDVDNKLTLTFKKDGVVSFTGKVGGTKVSGSSQLVNDGTGWSVTLYAPKTGTFDGWSETFDVTLTIGEKNVVEDVTVEIVAEEPPPAWGVGEYVGYGRVQYPSATPGGAPDDLWGMVYMDMAEDFSFTGRFVPVLGSPAPFSGKMYRVQVTEDHFGYFADDVSINVNGDDALLHFQFITMGFGKMSAQGEDPEGLDISFFSMLHNVWALDDFSEERPTFASGATKYLDLKDYTGLYSQAGTTYTDGDDLTFVFGEDGKVAVTGQIFGVPVNTTATLGVNDKIEEGAKFECRAYFEANGRIYYLTCEIPSSGTVTSDGIVVLYLALVNGW